MAAIVHATWSRLQRDHSSLEVFRCVFRRFGRQAARLTRGEAGHTAASDMFLRGTVVSARRARELGPSNEVVSRADELSA
jgi:enoyl-CoA hydratase/carnithine racemase